MLNIFSRGLSTEEVAKTLKKIRKQYNEYIVSYMMPTRLKEEFEKRYYFAAKYKENLATFFKNEIEILNELIKIEEEKNIQKQRDLELVEKKRQRTKEGGFADKILRDLEEKIKHYPEIDINPESSIEVRKLFGALKIFEDEHWNSISRYIKMTSSMGRMIDHLENDLWQLLGSERRNSPVLDRYLFLLERPGENLRNISHAEQECIKQVSFFFNELLDLYRHSSTISSPPNNAVEGYNYASQIVYNFRLADFKKN
jgi:hypothetical protein